MFSDFHREGMNGWRDGGMEETEEATERRGNSNTGTIVYISFVYHLLPVITPTL